MKNPKFISTWISVGIIFVAFAVGKFIKLTDAVIIVILIVSASLAAPLAIDKIKINFKKANQLCSNNAVMGVLTFFIFYLPYRFIWPFAHSTAQSSIFSATKIIADNFENSSELFLVTELCLLATLIAGLIFIAISYIGSMSMLINDVKKDASKPLLSVIIYAFAIVAAFGMSGGFLVKMYFLGDREINQQPAPFVKQLIVLLDFKKNFFCKNIPATSYVKKLSENDFYANKTAIATLNKNTNQYEFSIMECIPNY